MAPHCRALREGASRSTWAAFAVGLASLSVGCAGAAPLLHPAHVLNPGRVTVGAGVAGHLQATTTAEASGGDTTERTLGTLAVAPGVAPWAAGRIGIEGDNEAGLTYLGRSFRLDGRHAFALGPMQLSLGAGASAVVPRPDEEVGSAYGGGADLPILLGWKSDAELYSVWFGPRAGFELLQGTALEAGFLEGGRDELVPFAAKHFWVGGLFGVKVGFRTLHVALEVDAAYHFADGTFGEAEERDATLGAFMVTPSSALILAL